ncbi:MAG: hypothetical protein QM278_05490 [Pseudomonadota bacterium]|nr:hypothetical protein [Pseudomonadota bacterium]
MEKLTEKIDAILDIKYEALYLHERLLGGEPAVYGELERQFEELADRLYRENDDAITPRQYRTARDNYEFFMVLVELVLNKYREQAVKITDAAGEEQ